MADHFQPEEWQRINEKLDEAPDRYGFPERRDGSVLLGATRRERSPGNAVSESASGSSAAGPLWNVWR